MPKVATKLTDTEIKKAKPTEKEFTLWDGDGPHSTSSAGFFTSMVVYRELLETTDYDTLFGTQHKGSKNRGSQNGKNR